MTALIANLALQLDHYSFISELSLIHLAKLHETALSDGLKIPQPVMFRLVVVKPGSNCCRLPLKALEKDNGDKQDAATSVLLKEIEQMRWQFYQNWMAQDKMK